MTMNTTAPTLTRRRLLQTVAIGGAALAGCVSAPTSDAPSAGNIRTDGPSDLAPARSLAVDRVAADPTAVPPPIRRTTPETVTVHLTAREQVAEVEPGVTYGYMTFDGQIPGPMIRARVGDHVELSLTNDGNNAMPHNIDLHAVRGPGGGAEASLVAPGETRTFRFKATYPGLFVYHCAVPNLDHHISSGMFGAILVEPEEGLPEVDHEFYLGQHEVYTTGEAGEQGHHEFDFDAAKAEAPTYVLINGEKYAIGPDGYNEMRMRTGDTARVYFAVGGPNLPSSFHPIGSVWDEVWPQGAIESDPHRNVQTTPVLPGSAVIATLHGTVPGPIKLVDHSLTRVVRKGCLAVIDVQGPENPEVFDADEATSSEDASGDFGGWFDDVSNYDGVVDRTGRSEVHIEVGSRANGGPFGYSPAAVEVSHGTTVVWEWVDGMHDVVADDGSFKSQMTDDTTYTFRQTFDDHGVTKYYCTPHESLGMKGAIVVE